MSQPYQEQNPSDKRPQGDDQERLQYPGDEGRRPPLVQPDVCALIQDRMPRGGAGDKRYQYPDAQSDETDDQQFGHEPTEAGEEWPIGNRKDIR